MSIELNKPTHLGDGVYASYDGYQIGLRVNSAHNPISVYLDPQTAQALVDYIAGLKKERTNPET